jgi:F-type H+-transporting ATPase subunit delta
MNHSKIAVRYAKAFFVVAQEQNRLSEVKADMEELTKLCSQSDFILLLESPVVKTSRKKELFKALFDKTLQPLTTKFLVMMAENKREAFLPDIARDFIQIYRDSRGIKAAKVVTATPLDVNTRNAIEAMISKSFNTELELTTEINPELMGGFIIRVGDEQVDASVSSKLRQIKRQFLETSI